MTEANDAREMRRQQLVFSALCLLAVVIFVAIFEEGGIRGVDTAVHDLMAGAYPLPPPEFGWTEVAAFVALGLVVGVLGGMLGMGGGVLKIACLLLFFKFDMFFSRAVSIAAMFLMALSAAWQHYQRGAVIPEIVRPMILPAVLAAVGGAVLGFMLKSSTLTNLFGFFVVFLAFNTLAQLFSDPDELSLKEVFFREREKRRAHLAGSIGALHGFVCGLLGISGGVISTPMQQTLLHVPARHAIANSLPVSLACTGAGGAIIISTGLSRGDFTAEQILVAVLCIGLSAAAGARIGVELTGMASSAVLRVLFVIIIGTGGLSILL